MSKRNIVEVTEGPDSADELHKDILLPAGDPKRAQVQKKHKKIRKGDMVKGMIMFLDDCEEPTEPMKYIFKVDTAPYRFRKRLYENWKAGKHNCTVYFGDGAGGMDGLICEDDEHDDGDIYEDVEDWLHQMCKNDHKFRAPFKGKIDFSVTLVTVTALNHHNIARSVTSRSNLL
jgi:hypothetical protein